MRLILPLLLLCLLASGCAQNQGLPTPNQTAPIPAPPAPTTNISEPSAPQASGNITQLPPPQQNASQPSPNSTINITANTTPPAQNNATNATPPQYPPQNSTAQQPGLAFPDSAYSLFLDDVSLVPGSQGPCGIFSVRDDNGSVMDKLLICQGESDYWTSPQGHSYRIRVDEVAAGYSTHQNWAKVEIFG